MPGSAGTPEPVEAGPEESLVRQRDHEAIAHLADELLPALIAKLAASGLGEIEVHEGGWKARLRKPAAAPPVAPIAAAAARPGVARVADPQGAGGHSSPRPGTPRPEEAERRARPDEEPAEEPGIVAAKSPAVGIYHPRRDLVVGMRVRAGDRIGAVDVLGVKQDVVSPVDGVIGSSLAEAGEAVEYGQELVRIDQHENGGADPIRTAPAAAAGRA